MLERARLLWERNQQHDAMLSLQEVGAVRPMHGSCKATFPSFWGIRELRLISGIRLVLSLCSGKQAAPTARQQTGTLSRTHEHCAGACMHEVCACAQMIRATDVGPGGRASQLPAGSRQAGAEVVLQLARWTATGQGARADIAGAPWDFWQ